MENEQKKSFLLYNDLVNVVEKLIKKDRAEGTNDAGELFHLILEYVNGVDEKPVNFIVEMAFEPVKQQLDRDFDKWSVTRQKRIEAGKKGGEKSWEVRRGRQTEAPEAHDSFGSANEAHADFGSANEAHGSFGSHVTREEGAGVDIVNNSPKVRPEYAYSDDDDDMPF